MELNEIRCLSIQQPYAEWVVAGLKRIENRSWSSEYRGPLLIHASARKPSLDKWARADAEAIDQKIDELNNLPTGCIIGCVEFADVISRVREDGRVRGPGEFLKEIQKRLKPFGEQLEQTLLDQQRDVHYDYGIEYWWLFTKCRKFEHPIPCKGALRLWKPPTEILEKIASQI